MNYQQALFNVVSKHGAMLGKLWLRVRFDGEQFEERKFDKIQLRNVPIVTKPTNKYPIEFLLSEEYINMPQLLLLEETTYEVSFKASNDDLLTINELLPQVSKFFTLSLFTNTDISKNGLLNFHSYVGKTFLSVIVNGEKSLPIPIEIRSKKIGYADEYVQMMFDLSEDCSSLIYDSKSPVHHYFDFDTKEKRFRYEDFLFLQYLFRKQNLPDAYTYVKSSPHNTLKRIKETVPLGCASSIDSDALVAMVCSPEKLGRPKTIPSFWPKTLLGYMPNEITQSCMLETFNTPENRFVKYFLESISERITNLLKNVEEDYIKHSLKLYQLHIEEWLSDDWLKNVGSMGNLPTNSQVLQKKEGYREMYYFFLHMNYAFKFKWNELDAEIKAPEKKMSDLYEYWCYFRLISSLKKVAILKSINKELIKASSDGWEIRLKRGHKSCIKFDYLANNWNTYHLELYYNRRFSPVGTEFSRSYSLPFRPDYTLVIESDSKDFLPKYIHFDAKYRAEDEFDGFEFITEKETSLEKKEDAVNQKEEDFLKQVEQDEEMKRKYKDVDIYKMHTYKDAIICSLGAYILYPGDKRGFYREDYANKINVPSIGAFPLRPKKIVKNRQEENLSVFLKEILECCLYSGTHPI